ncbi:TniQ family protein [Streptomyces radicis]|uniref:TniQ family protein n=1 Tax=Streptomyces radicis TaxID=1750517 RepID=UPI001E351B2D|nr:TniQ family protein [Streptomyces radicis]
MHVAPLAGETAWSYLGRVAARYGMDPSALLGQWAWVNHRPQADGGGVRPDGEILFNPAGQQLLARVGGAAPASLARALPSWARGPADVAEAGEPEPLARWRVASAAGGPVAFGCRLCVARRTGRADAVVRYAQGWQRVCGRHHRWLLDADGGCGLEYLNLSGCPEVEAAQRRWGVVARRASRVGLEPEQVWSVASAVVCRWWDQALEWELERIWPARLHMVAGGDATADGRFWWWRAVARDAVVFPEVVTVAGTLGDPAMAELVWRDSGGGDRWVRPFGPGGRFVTALGERVGRPWLGEMAAAQYAEPLLAWMGAVARRRDGRERTGWFADDPWRVKNEHRPVTAAAQLRAMAKDAAAGGSGITWRRAVAAERRAVIAALIGDAEDQMEGLRGGQYGSARDTGRHLLTGLARTVGLLDQALWETASATVAAGVPLEDLAAWTGLPADVLVEEMAAGADGGR